MSAATELLLQAVLELPREERIVLHGAIERSIAIEDVAFDDADEELERELGRRIEDYRTGRIKALDGEEFFRQLKAEAPR